MVKIVKNPGNGRLNNINNLVLKKPRFLPGGKVAGA
jgi:hypothetical protein